MRYQTKLLAGALALAAAAHPRSATALPVVASHDGVGDFTANYPSSVPEPSSVALMLAGVAALVPVLRRRPAR